MTIRKLERHVVIPVMNHPIRPAAAASLHLVIPLTKLHDVEKVSAEFAAAATLLLNVHAPNGWPLIRHVIRNSPANRDDPKVVQLQAVTNRRRKNMMATFEGGYSKLAYWPPSSPEPERGSEWGLTGRWCRY